MARCEWFSRTRKQFVRMVCGLRICNNEMRIAGQSYQHPSAVCLFFFSSGGGQLMASSIKGGNWEAATLQKKPWAWQSFLEQSYQSCDTHSFPRKESNQSQPHVTSSHLKRVICASKRCCLRHHESIHGGRCLPTPCTAYTLLLNFGTYRTQIATAGRFQPQATMTLFVLLFHTNTLKRNALLVSQI